MGDHDPTVRPARRADRDATVEVLTRAFRDDPQMRWMLEGRSHLDRRLARFFATNFADHRRTGVIDVACRGTRIVGAALWKPPTFSGPGIVDQLVMMPGMLAAFHGRLTAAGRFKAAVVARHPTTPHWYLASVGVDPAAQGGGAGSALLRAGIARADAGRVPAYLESSTPANVPIYAHFGFDPERALDLPEGAPPMIPMWRPRR